MAYILLPPAAGVLLLITEHKSDYVRFHAWQSSLLFTFLAVGTPERPPGRLELVLMRYRWCTWCSRLAAL